LALLEIAGLSKSFGGNAAVAGVDIDIKSGEIVGLVGPNGAGKSTIFNLITGFLRPNNGTIKFKGNDITGLRPDQIARKGVGRTFQITLLFRGQTVLQSLLAGYVREHRTGFWHALFNTRSYQEEEEQALQRSVDTLQFMGLTEWKERLVSVVPLGLQRFLGIAQIIMSPVEILLLDEPLTGLNEEEIAGLLDRLKNLRSRGISIFIIEHHMKAVMAFCDRIIVINFGQKIAEGTPEEISKNPAVIEAYLGRKRGNRSAS
jgi:branched-chain amino acid transport system ATP-binding protein